MPELIWLHVNKMTNYEKLNNGLRQGRVPEFSSLVNRLALILLVILLSINSSFGQGKSVLGTWSVKKMTCYERRDYPPFGEEVTQISNPSGSLTFQADGKGVIRSTTLILCNLYDFYWYQNGDTLIMAKDSLAIPFYQKMISASPNQKGYYSLIHQKDSNNVLIERAPGCNRLGYASWYDIVLERTN